jgi:antitoxin MazE
MVTHCITTGGGIVIKNLVKHGNSWALVIDRPILDLLKISPEEPVEITTDGSAVIITSAATKPHKEKVQQARQKVNAKYKEAFKKLAE